MSYTVAEIKNILGAKWLQKTAPDARPTQLMLDSRVHAPGSSAIFFAIPGQRHDGHDFLPNCYANGVRHFIVSQPVQPEQLPEANILLVNNTLDALQQLAAHHRAQFQLPVIGITGSNGKTVVKEWLSQLAQQHRVVRSPKSYNSQIGVPLSVWQLQPEHELGIFEAGISTTGEMERLTPIARPDIGIFTNLGPAHREGFPSRAVKLAEKMLLFDTAHTLIVCADHTDILQAAEAWRKAQEGRRLFTWSLKGRPASFNIKAEQRASMTRLHCTIAKGTAFVIEFPFPDAASTENICHCMAALLVLGYTPADFQNPIRKLEPVEMRLELKAGINRCTLINDAYSNDLASLRIALQFARQQLPKGPLTLILSDFLQSGQTLKDLYGEVAELIRRFQVERLIAIGQDIKTLETQLPDSVKQQYHPDTTSFLQQLQNLDFNEELILVKGARAFAFERIAQRLEQKAHKTVLEVNLSALVHNLNQYNRILRPGTKIMVMVKAAGYGSGSEELAKLLEFHQVDYLGVAYADEGIELRKAGVQLPILVLNPEPASFESLVRYRLEPEVYSLELLHELLKTGNKEKGLHIHLKIDTGMHRLGFEADDMPELISRLQANPWLRVQSVFSHLAASDNPAHDAFTHQQARTFTDMYEQLEKTLGYHPMRHIANTSGMVRFPEYQFEIVRLGIGLYGIDASGLQDQLRVVNTLKATISQIKDLQGGETVGYNRNGPIDRPSRIATISIGYADGLLRLAGNGRYSVLVHGKRAATVGNVCMDMTMIDVTDIPEASEGDEVIIFGEQPPVQELAECLQTIPYEVFTNIAGRVKRVYWQE